MLLRFPYPTTAAAPPESAETPEMVDSAEILFPGGVLSHALSLVRRAPVYGAYLERVFCVAKHQSSAG